MSIILEKGMVVGDSIEFTHYSKAYLVEAKVWVSRSEWEAMGSPNRVEVQVKPVYG